MGLEPIRAKIEWESDRQPFTGPKHRDNQPTTHIHSYGLQLTTQTWGTTISNQGTSCCEAPVQTTEPMSTKQIN